MANVRPGLDTLVCEAIEIADADARAAYLDRACGDDNALRQRVEALVVAHFQAGSFLEQPAYPTGCTAPHGRAPGELALAQFTEGPGARVGPYKLLEQIGEGGMGLVFVAEQQQPIRRRVALKVIKPGMDSRQVIARFEQERQALALMDHPNIAKVLDAGATDTGRPFFVMELVKGTPITDYCDQQRLMTRQRLGLFLDVCQAVQHAHHKGIIHRDLKPSNILVEVHDVRPVVKVIDFGIAKAIGQQLTERTVYTGVAQLVGTPLYMSPEQAGSSSLDVDTRSDVYSLGVLLYELLTGTTPFDGETLKQAGYEEMRRIIREDEPPRPSTRVSTLQAKAQYTVAEKRGVTSGALGAQLRGELDWIVMKCLEKDRNRRYDTANGLARDLGRYLSDEPVEARPTSAGYRLGKFLRRNRGPVLAAGLLLLALVAGMAGTALGLVRAEQARADEAWQRELAEANEAKALRAVAAETVAKERESQQRAKAEQARDRARQALDAMTSSATGDSLTTQSALSDQQKRFLAEVLTYYQEFAGEQADDEQARARTAQAASRVGQIEYRLGRRAEGVVAARRALGLYTKLAADFPAVAQYRQDLAQSHTNLAKQLAGLGQHHEADRHYRQALARYEKLAAEFPAVPEYRRDLAQSHNNLSTLLAELGKRQEAEGHLRKSQALQEKLAAEFPAAPSIRRGLAQSHTNLGNLLAELGQQKAAERHHRQALALFDKLAADSPAAPEYRSNLAACHTNLGALLAGLGRYQEAERHHRQALPLREKLAAEFPAVPEHRRGLAQNHANLGLLVTRLLKAEEAERHHLQALALYEKLAAEFPALPEYRRELAFCHNNLGNLLGALERLEEAERHHRQVLALYEKLAAEFPAVPEYRLGLGGAYCNAGNLLAERGKPADSLPWYDRAITTLTAVHKTAPPSGQVQQYLRNCYWGRARANDALRKHPVAVQDWGKAAALSPAADRPNFRASGALARFKAGQEGAAMAEVVDVLKMPEAPGPALYACACVYALASAQDKDQQPAYVGRAMTLLRRAVQAGFDDADRLKQDPDLNTLRGREDFKKLVAELEKAPPE